MKNIHGIMAVFVSLVFSAQANLINRYDFNGDANDAIGTPMNGNLSINDAPTNEEAPLFTTDIPSGADTGFAAHSLEVGMTIGSGNVSFVNFGGGTQTEIYDGKVGSMAYWFKADALNNAKDLVSSVGGAGALRTLSQSDGDVRLGGAGQGNVDFTFTNPVVAGTWHHLVVAWDDPGGLLTIALDGQIQTDTFTSGDLTDPSRLIVGNFANNDSQPGTQFEGHIYDLQFYDTKLSSGDINFLANNAGLAIPEPSAITLLGLGMAVLAMARRYSGR